MKSLYTQEQALPRSIEPKIVNFQICQMYSVLDVPSLEEDLAQEVRQFELHLNDDAFLQALKILPKESCLRLAHEKHRQKALELGFNILSSDNLIEIDHDIFNSIAKLRAGVHAKKNVEAKISQKSYEEENPYNNFTRATLATLAAMIGGADSITIEPHNVLTSHYTRTIPLILKYECELTKVQDPFGGSWYLENLTQTFIAAYKQAC